MPSSHLPMPLTIKDESEEKMPSISPFDILQEEGGGRVPTSVEIKVLPLTIKARDDPWGTSMGLEILSEPETKMTTCLLVAPSEKLVILSPLP